MNKLEKIAQKLDTAASAMEEVPEDLRYDRRNGALQPEYLREAATHYRNLSKMTKPFLEEED